MSAALDAPAMKDELRNGRPVVVAITPSGDPVRALASMNAFYPAQHVALVVGYADIAGSTWYRVNDPFPYLQVGMMPAYVSAGGVAQIDLTGTGSVAYWIEGSALRSKLNWSESFLVRLDGTH